MIIWLNSLGPTSKVVFLDRDGIINRDSPNYIKTIDEFEIFDDVVKALRLVVSKGYGLVIVSNQSGLGRGIIKSEDFWEIHFYLVNFLRTRGCALTAAFYCPHRPEDNCFCRKPQPGMLVAASEILSIDLKQSFFIGDRLTDMETAARAGCKGILIVRNNNAYYNSSDFPVFRGLIEATSLL